MTVTAEKRPGRGWNTYAAILLIFAGAMQILDGLWALDRQDTAIDSLFWGDNVEAWGWVYLIVGIVLVVIGAFIFKRASWATLAGIGAAFLGAIVNLFWIFTYPLVSILAITLYLLAVYGLTTYSLEELD
jgi:dolichyl-phosphate-mannose--protein O-mannosyl transferase